MTTTAAQPRRLADLVRLGDADAPYRLVLYGIEGIGKTTWAAGAPAPPKTASPLRWPKCRAWWCRTTRR
jgi:hypothetical protein